MTLFLFGEVVVVVVAAAVDAVTICIVVGHDICPYKNSTLHTTKRHKPMRQTAKDVTDMSHLLRHP